MARLASDFRFDNHTYVVIVGTDASARVTSLRAVPMQKGSQAQAIARLAEMFTGFLADGVSFDDLLNSPVMSPLGVSLLTGVERALRLQKRGAA